MSDIRKWKRYKYKRYIGKIKQKLTGTCFNSYAGRKLCNPEEGNILIEKLIISGKPCAIARFGSVEMNVIAKREALKVGTKEPYDDVELCTNAGFFPYNEKLIDDFAKYVIKEVHNIDFLGVWFNRAEEYVVDRYMPNTTVGSILSIEPYIFDTPWSRALANKKVLVIHPFEDSIKEQYNRAEKLFANPQILPVFELYTIKAVQTIANKKDDRFKTWFDALEHMKKQMDEIDFDVAIIGCGAYGMALAIHAKKIGKQAIHMGGATQILFGIKGRRWDDNPVISKLYNEYWIRPGKNETVVNQETIEGACYW